MPDVFASNKTSHGPGSIVSSNMALLSIGGKTLHLCQTATVSYTRNGGMNFELGSDSVWLIGGPSSGRAQITRMVGEVGLLKPYAPNSPCETTTLNISKGIDECGMDPGIVTCLNAYLTSVTTSLTVANMAVTDGAEYLVGSVSI